MSLRKINPATEAEFIEVERLLAAARESLQSAFILAANRVWTLDDQQLKRLLRAEQNINEVRNANDDAACNAYGIIPMGMGKRSRRRRRPGETEEI